MFRHILGMLPRTKIGKSDSNDVGSGPPSSVSGARDTSAQGTPFERVATNILSGSIGKIFNNEATYIPSSVHVHGVGDGHVSYPYEPLPLFRDVATSERQNLFIRKLNLCSTVFDFTDNTTTHAKEKEVKRQTLIELFDFVMSANNKFSELAVEEAVKMVGANVFRTFRPSVYLHTGVESFDPEEEESTTEPAWAHLHLVYEFFLRFIMSSEMDTKIAKRYIDRYFVLKLMDLFDSEDSRERDFLKSILHKIYSKFMVHRSVIRRAMGDIFYRFIFETERHNGIAELLEILGSIINGFALPLKEEHKLFLVRTMIPLHKPKCVSIYHRQLSYSIIQFLEKDLKLADIVIKGLLKYWPVTNSQKEVLFLGELEEVLEMTQPAEFHRCMVPLFRQIGRCLNSPHFQVAERALFLWNNDHIVGLATQNRSVVLPVIYSALEKNTKGHWNQAVHSLTLNARKMFIDMDEELFLECKHRFEEEEEEAKRAEERRERTWQRLEAAAGKA